MTDSPNDGAPAPDPLQASLHHQRILSRFGAHALTEDDLPALLQHAAACAAEGLNMERAKVLRYRRETDDLLVVAGVRWHEGVVGHAVVTSDPDTPPGRAVATRQPVMVADLRREHGMRANRLLREHGVISALNVPIITDDSVWGVLEVDGSEPHGFQEMEELFIKGFTHLLSAAIRRTEAEASARIERAQSAATGERLLRSEARYRAAFEQAAVGICEAGRDDRILHANDRFCAIAGHARDELQRLRFQDIVHPDDRPAILALTEQVHAGTLPSFTEETRYLRKDGGTVWVNLSCSAVRDAAGQPAYVLAIVADISARKRAEAEREELMRQQELLMREMNHRIKNSLQMVALLVHMQAADIRDPAIRARFDETATRIATVALVHQRLYQASELESVESAIYLRDLCDDITAALGLSDGQLTVEAVDTELPADTAIALGLIVNELVTNAAKYAYPMDVPGPVRVKLDRTPEGRLRLTVSDEGFGLPPGFDPAASSGLGMRVLVALTEKIDAHLRLRDGGQGGHGVCFEVVLRGP